MSRFHRYPRTPHLAGSGLGDPSATDRISLSDLAGGTLVIEEKFDGANAAFGFSSDGNLELQSRGHLLLGGPRERQFDLFKAWVRCHEQAFADRLQDRYRVFGEWCHARHTIFYDRLPHLFLEFDVLDMKTQRFLSTPARRELLDGLPIVSVPVLFEGHVRNTDALRRLMGPSLGKSPEWRGALREAAIEAGADPDRALAESPDDDRAEGLYIKHERDGETVGRAKFVRAGFVQTILDSDSHWSARPLIHNRLAPGVDMFAAPAAAPSP